MDFIIFSKIDQFFFIFPVSILTEIKTSSIVSLSVSLTRHKKAHFVFHRT